MNSIKFHHIVKPQHVAQLNWYNNHVRAWGAVHPTLFSSVFII